MPASGSGSRELARASNGALGGPYWVNGEFTLRIRGPAIDRIARIRRPFALLGRIEGSDIRIDDRAVSARHVYLHLDQRGVFGVDLATRTGTRFAGGHSSGWLHPGQSFVVAAHKIELIDVQLEGAQLEAAPHALDPLADASYSALMPVTLHAIHARHVPRALGSELVFVGRGSSCGVRVEGATASRVHCVLVRTMKAVYVVDLIGRGTWINGELVSGAVALSDGDTLTIGSARFHVRTTAGTEIVPVRGQAAPPDLAAASTWPLNAHEAASLMPGFLPPGTPPLPGTIPAEAQGAVLAWMMGALQAGQAEALRRQGEFHLALTRLIQQMQRDNANLLNEHLDRMERIDRELANLRGEIYRRFGSAEAANAAAANAALPAPDFPEGEVPPALRVAPAPKPADSDSAEAAAWLVARVSQLEEEQRSTWKDMVTRLTGRGR
jgi:pSer/pThr/pTyr-binding forkhead associated (FHA) protein